MGRIFYTSDLHFSHSNIIQYCNRPFDSVEQMNDTLINNGFLIFFDSLMSPRKF